VDLYPAIDIRGGRVARAPAGVEPLAAGRALAHAGARWVHLVDLDRAYQTGENRDAVRRFLAEIPLRVQVGGGIASDAAISELLAWGAARVVVGPRAASDAALLGRLVARHGADRVAVGIDVRDGRLTARGSGAVFDGSAVSVAVRARELGARTIVYADAARDGALTGPDIAGAQTLAAAGLDVIVSGGVAALDDLHAIRGAGLAGAIVGRALHEGRFTVEEALACLA